MSKLVRLLKSGGIMAATGLSAYGGIELSECFINHFPDAYMIPQTIQGLSAFMVGATGHIISRSILIKDRRLSNMEARSIAALNAFANADNNERGISTEESLKNISDNVVEVEVRSKSRIGRGSGLMMTSDGYVLTAHHVVRDALENGGRITVKTQKGKSYHPERGKIVYNGATDLAIVKLKKISAFPKPIRIKVDQECDLRRGDEIRILGFRDGQNYNTLGMITNPNYVGIIGDRTVYDLFRTNARGLSGQSGGVIVNGKGELVGINIFSSLKVGEAIGELGGAKLSNALNYINRIAAKKSAKIF